MRRELQNVEQFTREDVMTGIELAHKRASKPLKSLHNYAEATVETIWDGQTEDGTEFCMTKEQHIKNTELSMQMGAVEAGGENLAKGLLIGAGVVGLAWVGRTLYNRHKMKKQLIKEINQEVE